MTFFSFDWINFNLADEEILSQQISISHLNINGVKFFDVPVEDLILGRTGRLDGNVGVSWHGIGIRIFSVVDKAIQNCVSLTRLT